MIFCINAALAEKKEKQCAYLANDVLIVQSCRNKMTNGKESGGWGGGGGGAQVKVPISVLLFAHQSLIL